MLREVMRVLAEEGLPQEQLERIAKRLRGTERAAEIREQARKRKQKQRSCHAGQSRVTGLSTDINNHVTRDVPGTLFAQESLSTTESVKKDSAPQKRGTRLPGDWQLPEPQHTWALQQGLSNEEIAALVEDFRDYWIAVPGQKGIKLDWSATFRQRVRWFLNSPRRQARASKPNGSVSYAKSWALIRDATEERVRRGWG